MASTGIRSARMHSCRAAPDARYETKYRGMTSNMHARAHSDTTDPAQRAASAVDRLLRPLVRLLVGRVACIYVVDRVRRIYLEESRAWLARTHADQRITRSRLAMLTGLDTRTIASLGDGRPESGAGARLPAHEICAGSVVIDRWLNDPEFLDEDGRPMELPVLGVLKSFQTLTSRAVGRNITPHTVLEQLVESGNVSIDDKERVRLDDPVYRPVRESEETALDVGAHSIARLVETVRSNVEESSNGKSSNGKRKLQQDRLSARIPADRYPELQARSRELLERHMAEMECLLAEYETADHAMADREMADEKANGRGDSTRRLGVGWYVFD